ncbi:MAG: carboxypeptidase regulatory-like domain-containing protein, partial [Acidimicrobiia bacterium]|nr:carboxypeptidase regulatory-like domain-containing protein [Acidimicrobiia bacterium]
VTAPDRGGEDTDSDVERTSATTAVVTVASGDSVSVVDGGLWAPVTLSGVAWLDVDNDGVRESGEPPLEGVTLTLEGLDGTGAPVGPITAVTGADGTYTFTDLPPGTYTVTGAQPADLLDGDDRLGTAGGSLTDDRISGIVLVSPTTPGATVASGYDFGEIPPASISGVVWADTDGDGVRDPGEPGLPGVSVTLIGTDDRGNPVERTVTTGPDGDYSFDDLRPGTYTVTEEQPVGYADGDDVLGTTGGTLGDDEARSIDLPPGGNGSGYDFGELGAFVGDTVFDDLDGDGVQDADEPGLAGVEVVVRDAAGTVVDRLVTDDAGRYRSGPLPAGTYTVAVTPSTLPSNHVPTVDLDGLATPHEAVATLVAGQTRSDVDFGYTESIDLLLDKAAGVLRDGRVDWTITVHNDGPAPTTGMLTITDELPGTLRYVSASGDGWSCSVNGQTVTCSRPDSLTAGLTLAPIVVVTDVVPGATGVITNSASVRANGVERSTSNNIDRALITVATPAPPTTIVRPPAGTPDLSRTGAEVVRLVLLGGALLLAGVALVAFARRHRRRQA